MIHFTQYASNKFTILEEHSFLVSREDIVDVIENPDAVDITRLPLYIAEKRINKNLLKVAYKKEGSVAKIITFYPFRK